MTIKVKNFIFYILMFVCLISCKESYIMPNYFKHKENGSVKQITIESFYVTNGALEPTGNAIVIWGEESNNTITFDKNGNILSDKNRTFNYDENGKLSSIQYAGTSEPISYNELNEISKIGDKSVRYNEYGQICNIEEVVQVYGYFPASRREYEYNDRGQMTLCKINNGYNMYGSEYNDNGELIRHVYMMSGGRAIDYTVEITTRDEHNNWTERRVYGTDGTQSIQKRTIRYY